MFTENTENTRYFVDTFYKNEGKFPVVDRATGYWIDVCETFEEAQDRADKALISLRDEYARREEARKLQEANERVRQTLRTILSEDWL